MSRTCPNGHFSNAEDYCDTCGVPMPVEAVPVETVPVEAEPVETVPVEASAAADGAEADGAEADRAGASSTASASATPEPAEPVVDGAPGPEPVESLDCPHCQAPNPPGALFCEACGYDFTTGAMPRGAAATTPSPAQPPSNTSASADLDAPAGAELDWVAEVWVDPDWYRTQEVEDPCPSPGLPTIVPLRRTSVLLGRVSASKNTHPEIELSTDPGVSRRHAQLTTDGTRWFVEDLGSSNGTFVGPASGALPEQPIPVGPKTELSDDDRLYVGAWTRVVVRRATPEDVQTLP